MSISATHDTEKIEKLEAEIRELRAAHTFATNTGERAEAWQIADQIREFEQLIHWIRSQGVPQG